MRIPIATNYEPMVLALKLRAKQKTDVRIRVADAKKPNCSYTDRMGSVSGTKTFYVRMPHTGKLTVADIFAPGTDPKAANQNIELVSKEILNLPTFSDLYKGSELIKCGMAFIQWFSENCGWLSAGVDGSVYGSDCNRFRIDYLDVIRDMRTHIPSNPADPKSPKIPNPAFGHELTTPARISQDRGLIQVSQKYFVPKPVPERVGILTHEISHFYINNDQHNEEEADENAINIFLGYGYGFIDADNAFSEVFKNADTPENRKRYEQLHGQIVRIEQAKNKLK